MLIPVLMKRLQFYRFLADRLFILFPSLVLHTSQSVLEDPKQLHLIFRHPFLYGAIKDTNQVTKKLPSLQSFILGLRMPEHFFQLLHLSVTSDQKINAFKEARHVVGDLQYFDILNERGYV